MKPLSLKKNKPIEKKGYLKKRFKKYGETFKQDDFGVAL